MPISVCNIVHQNLVTISVHRRIPAQLEDYCARTNENKEEIFREVLSLLHFLATSPTAVRQFY